MKNELSQLDFLTLTDFSFGNAPLFYEDIPERLKNSDDINKIANYNNMNKGIITNDFFLWALDNNISYDAICWFIKDFSGQDDIELTHVIDALFNHYTIFLDESNNCVKFRFKDTEGNTNVKWYNDFVLSGIVLESDMCSFNVDELFGKFELQSNISDVKLKHIAAFNGEDYNRFVEILKSSKISILLDTLLQVDGVYIHWMTENLLYYSLVDIVDSVLEIPFMLDGVKNILFNHAVRDGGVLLNILAQYDYPNIKEDKVFDFCNEFISWIDCLEPQNPEEDFELELLRQGTKTSRKANNLLFLQGNKDKLLIEDFVPMYAMRIATFPNSQLYFDKCGIVEDNIDNHIQVYGSSKLANYEFVDSKNNRWIQLSDMISGIHGALMAYINTHDVTDIYEDLQNFDEIQNHNLKKFLGLKKKSSMKNKFFDNMSKNIQQIERIQFLMDYCNL